MELSGERKAANSGKVRMQITTVAHLASFHGGGGALGTAWNTNFLAIPPEE